LPKTGRFCILRVISRKLMKIRLFIIAFFAAFSSLAQPILVSENFTTVDSLLSAGTPPWAQDFTLKKSMPNSIRAVVGNASTAALTTISFNTTSLTNLSLSFWHICKVQIYDTARVEISTDNGATWAILPASSYQGQSGAYASITRFASNSYTDWQPNDNQAQPNNGWWKQEVFNLNTIGIGFTDVKVRFILKDGTAFPGANGNYGWVIDDVKILGANSEIIPPVITYANPVYQNFIFNNVGPYTVKTTITDASGVASANLFYSVNNASFNQVAMTNPSGNNWQGIIPAVNYNDTVDYYVVATDASASHNQAKAPVNGYNRFIVRQTSSSGTYDIPFLDNFESSFGWKANPTTGSVSVTAWEYGKPNYNIKNSVHSGLNCWSTNKNVPYANNSNAILTSPPFDFKNAFNVIFSFYTNYKTYDDKDGMRIEFSKDSGATWQILGSASDTGWYNTANINNTGKPGFTGNSSGWKQYKHSLSDLDFYADNYVMFRFIFTSDAANIAAGFSIDDVGLLYDLTVDVGAATILTPTDKCTALGLQKVRAVVQNYGAIIIQDTIPVAYRLNSNQAVVEKFYLHLAPGEIDTVTFTNPINIPAGNHQFKVLTVYEPDEIYGNDLTEITFSTGSLKNLPYVNKFENALSINDFCLDNGSESSISLNNVNPINGGQDLIFDSKTAVWTTPNPSLQPKDKKYIWRNDVNASAKAIARLCINSNNQTKVMMQLKVKLKTMQDTPITNYFRIAANGKQISPTIIPQNNNETNLSLLYDLSSVLPDNSINLEFQAKNSKGFDDWGVATFVDDILIYAVSNRDVAANKIITNANAWPLVGDSVNTALELKNVGLFKVDTSVVKVYVNNVKIDSLFKINSIFPNQSDVISFNKKFALTAGKNEIKIISNYYPDQNRYNDTIVAYIYAWPYLSTPYFNNFDTDNGYFLSQSNNKTKWEWGAPAKAYLDSAYSTPKAWVTNLSTDYFSKSRAYLYSPVFDFSNGKNPIVSFYQKRMIEPGKDGFNLQYTTDGQTWAIAGVKADPKASNWYNTDSLAATLQPAWTGQSESFEKSSIRLPQLSFKNKAQFRFLFASNDSVASEGTLIDNFSIYIPNAIDVGVSKIFTPIISNTDPNKAFLKVQIKNYGQDTIYSVPVSYQTNNGNWVTETWNGILYPFSVVNQTFVTSYNIPPGNYEVCAKTALTNDQDITNDKLCGNYYGIPVITPNYINTFENTAIIPWTKMANVWEFGTPAASNAVINAPYSGQNCWKTKLSGNYPDNSTDYLYTPYFNFSCSDSVVMSFMNRFDFESGKDGGVIEYTTNRGINWSLFDTTGATNWYNNNSIAALGTKGWSGNSNGWKNVIISLNKFEGKPDLVRFRFKFSSNGTVNRNGWGIDDFNITAKEKYDIALTNYNINPLINSVGDVVNFKINGLSKKGTLIDTLNFALVIDGNTTTEQFLINPSLDCNQTFSYTFNYNYHPTAGNHTGTIFSYNPNNKIDLDKTNDTLKFNFATRDVNSVVDLTQQNKKCYDFEGSSENWLSTNALSGGLTQGFNWETGNPLKTFISGSKTGNSCVVAGLSSNYPNNESMALTSPPMIMDSGACYTISFWHNYDFEQPYDGGSLEYSTNKGTSWSTFGASFEANWMNTPKISSNKNNPGWSGTSNGWVYATHIYHAEVRTPITFRFILTSNSSITREGWAIDNFCIEKMASCFVGINDVNSTNPSVLLYPNPTNGFINFQFNSIKNQPNSEIKIYDVIGKTVYNQLLNLPQGISISAIDISNLAKGIYHYQTVVNNTSFTGKIIVQ